VPASSIAEQTANLTNIEQADKIYPGDLKVVVNVLGVLSGRADKDNETSDGDRETNQFTEVRFLPLKDTLSDTNYYN